ncbi:hypothetical protein D3Z50_03690 [Clostridiaceae bacterium]|nr:hypothetical protein [Clostridiaceae bacterium]
MRGVFCECSAAKVTENPRETAPNQNLTLDNPLENRYNDKRKKTMKETVISETNAKARRGW